MPATAPAGRAPRARQPQPARASVLLLVRRPLRRARTAVATTAHENLPGSVRQSARGPRPVKAFYRSTKIQLPWDHGARRLRMRGAVSPPGLPGPRDAPRPSGPTGPHAPQAASGQLPGELGPNRFPRETSPNLGVLNSKRVRTEAARTQLAFQPGGNHSMGFEPGRFEAK